MGKSWLVEQCCEYALWGGWFLWRFADIVSVRGMGQSLQAGMSNGISCLALHRLAL